jgi:hypothetical protein
MRRIAKFVMLGLCLTAAACGESQTIEAPRDPVVIEAIQLKPCPDPDPMQACRFDHTKAPEYLAEALKGNYQAQRNIAALHDAALPWIIKRPIQACGWRMVALASRPADSTHDEVGAYRIQCGQLSAADFADATTLANAIYRRIHDTDLPASPALK